MVFGVAYNHNASSAAFNFIPLRNILRRIVCPLGMKIRTYLANNRAHIFLCKNYHRVHVRQSRQNFSAFFRRHHRPPFTLQRAYRCVVIHRDNQFAAEFPRSMQVPYVPNVQHIEAPIRERNAIAGAPPFRYSLVKLLP